MFTVWKTSKEFQPNKIKNKKALYYKIGIHSFGVTSVLKRRFSILCGSSTGHLIKDITVAISKDLNVSDPFYADIYRVSLCYLNLTSLKNVVISNWIHQDLFNVKCEIK